MSSKRKLSQEVMSKAGSFLFDVPSDESHALNMRSRIRSDKMMKVLLYYQLMEDALGSQIARKIKMSMEEMLISYEGQGREEAVKTLQQNAPKRVEVDKGSDGVFDDE